jgi:hypothetical protein
MRKIVFCLLFLFGIVSLSSAQNTVNDIFTKKEIIWYGFDFSHIKMIGSSGFSNPEDIVKTFFSAWNNIIFDEPQKFSIMRLMKMRSVKFSLGMVKELNSKVDPSQMVIDYGYNLTSELVDEIVGNYKPVEQKGIGLVFIMESFNQNDKIGNMWVTFFDVSTKTILLTKKMTGDAGGSAEFRNYWIKSIYNVLLTINTKELKVWESQYTK